LLRKRNANIPRLKLSKYLLTDYWLDISRSAYLFSHVLYITPLMPLTRQDSKALTGEQKIEAQASDKDSLYNITPN